MVSYKFSHSITIRYSDLDPQGHVNNAVYMSYFEHGRIHYLLHLGLFRPGQSFQEIGIIVATAQITYLQPIHFGQNIAVGVAVTRLGNKSLDVAYRLFDSDDQSTLAEGSTVLVAFDYHAQKTIPLPAHWREKIRQFENLSN